MYNTTILNQTKANLNRLEPEKEIFQAFGLNDEQKHFARLLAEAYRMGLTLSGCYKQGLYARADREPVIHHAAVAINRNRRRRSGTRGRGEGNCGSKSCRE